jgi:hypothetical protein
VNRQAGQAPGVVKIRLSGEPADLESLTHILSCGPTKTEAIEVIEESALYANRRDPGCRLYLTVRLTPGDQQR